MDIVVAKNKSVAAGRDVNITINFGTSDSKNEIVGNLLRKLGMDPEFDKPLIGEGKALSIEERVRNILMVEKSSASDENGTYDAYFVGISGLEASVRAGIQSIKDRQYLKAHKTFEIALNSNPPEKIKTRIIYDYFISGYIGYSFVSNMDAIREIISELRLRHHKNFNRSIDISIAEAHQEIATRQTTSDMLIENEGILVELFKTYGNDDIKCLNLLGLLCRRLGERESLGDKRLHYLTKAMDTFSKIQLIEGEQMSVEARNNWSMTLIRHFEVAKDERSLDMAETILGGIDYQAKSLPLSDFLALPKALNSRGNIYKKRMSQSADVHYYSAAIEEYDRTSIFWDESEAPYDWALIQKNKADARWEYMKISGFNKKIAETALKEISHSLKYRNESDAPYQYNRSMDVKIQLEKMLSDSL